MIGWADRCKRTTREQSEKASVMKRQVWNGKTLAALAFVAVSGGCSSDCAPIDNGGVIVDITGASNCGSVSIAATDGVGQFEFDTWPATDADGGPLCSFRGLSGHTGTFTINVSVDGNVVASQSVTLERVDACNFSGKALEFDLSHS
jgi:uncharacterized membrane protein